MSTTYMEPVGRFRILRHDDLPEEHKAAYRARGEDPDDIWGLIWSFSDAQVAANHFVRCVGEAADWQTYKLVDGKEAITIERQAWF